MLRLSFHSTVWLLSPLPSCFQTPTHSFLSSSTHISSLLPLLLFQSKSCGLLILPSSAFSFLSKQNLHSFILLNNSFNPTELAFGLFGCKSALCCASALTLQYIGSSNLFPCYIIVATLWCFFFQCRENFKYTFLENLEKVYKSVYVLCNVH